MPGWRVEDFHRLLTEFFEEGVVQGKGSEFEVVQRGAGANMSVDVGSGLALIEFTTTLLSPNATLKSWLYSDDVVNVTVPAADATNPRIDRIVAKFDVSDDPNTAASNIVSIELVEGTPAGSPSAPAEPSNAITLATVSVPASDTAITDAQITDARPFVTMSTDVLADVIRAVNLASTANGKGASLIGVEDAAGDYTATTAEDVFAEIATRLGDAESDIASLQSNGFYGDGSDGALNVTSGTTTIDATAAVNGVLIKQYTSFNVSAGATLTFNNVPAGGLTFVVLCQGNFTMAGTITGTGLGAAGAAQVSISRTSTGFTVSNGNQGTASNLAFGQERRGSVGQATADDENGVNESWAAASGGGGSANSATDGAASSAADAGAAVDTAASAAAGGVSLTTALLKMLGNMYGITLAPGAGGVTGGVAVAVDGYASGTLSATSGPGGAGGMSVLVFCGGDYSMTGTVNLSGAASTASTAVTCAGSRVAAAAGGSSGGASGNWLAFVRGTITNSGTYTLNAGAVGATATVDSGAGAFATATAGGVSASGTTLVVPTV